MFTDSRKGGAGWFVSEVEAGPSEVHGQPTVGKFVMPKGDEQVRDPILNFEELLAPIPGEEPAGPASKYIELRPQFEEMRREITPERAAQLKEDVKDPDWRGQERKTKEALAGTTKDLRIAGYLLESLVKNHHFAGARDGLKLLRLMVEQCWDRLNPPVDPEDPEVRVGPFFWLDDAEKSMRFPTTLRMTPLLIGRERAYSLEEARPRGEKLTDEAKALRAEADRAAERAPADKLNAVFTEVGGCLEELDELVKGLTARVGAEAPSLNNVRTTLEECQTFLGQILQKRPDAAPKPDTEAEGGAPAAEAGGVGRGPGASRVEIYRRLEQAALALKDLEPHSPIPYLLLRAVELGNLPFPQLMKELIRDENSLTELKREFGIKDPPAPPSE